RLDADYMILRGRVAGSSEAGRIILLPYNQISSLAINRALLDNDVEALFGDVEASEPSPAATIPSTAMPTARPAEKPVSSAAPQAPAATASSRSAAPGSHKPSKSILLARLRARLAAEASQPS